MNNAMNMMPQMMNSMPMNGMGMMPMNAAHQEAFMEVCKNMTSMMDSGMPMMMNFGGMMMMCMMAASK